MTVSWNDPVSSSDEEIPWMKGSAVAARCICLIYNPDPTGGINSLDMRQDGVVPGLGIFDSRLASDVWTVCALLRTTLSFPDPSPAATIYYVRTVLEQRAATTSPRDPEGSKPIVSMTPFAVWEKGVRPPKVPTRSSPAVWRGRQAGGSDTGTLQVSGIGRLPNDETGRPSTLPGIITPIHVDHELAIEVFYSIDGEDVAGNPLAKGQPPGVRLLRIVKPTIVPSCGCIPEALELPSYDQLADCAAAAVPCPTCKLVPNEQVCRTCDLTTLLHPRHDLFQYGPNGVCPDCDKRFLQSDEKSKWKDCACGLNLGDMWERMASVMPPDVESVVGSCSAWPDSKRDGSNTPPTPP
jgi:hypothetical protein